MTVTVKLENGEVLTLKRSKQLHVGLTLLEGGYSLTSGFRLYKEKDNIICGEEVEYKSLDISISK